MKVIVPLAGQSSRYGFSRPKWMLTMPNGNLMIKECLKNIDMTEVEEVVLVPLQSHLDNHISADFLSSEISSITSVNTTILPLTQPTSCQAETVSQALTKIGGDFPIFIKDCDNSFSAKPVKSNSVFYIDLNSIEFVNARNKSYIAFDSLKRINRIVEKKVVSSYFCVGGYSFESSLLFLESYERIRSLCNLEIYISNVVYEMISNHHIFHASEVTSYEDWGTRREYKDTQSRHQTIFCDFDGVLVVNSSSFDTPPWKYDPIHENIQALQDLCANKSICLVITTSRPHAEKTDIISFCQTHGLTVYEVVTGLPHCKRILVNDHSPTNSYPAAVGISVPRNLRNLDSFLNF